jgi:hypothetical protein
VAPPALCNLSLTRGPAFGTVRITDPCIPDETFVCRAAQRTVGPAEEYGGSAEGRPFDCFKLPGQFLGNGSSAFPYSDLLGDLTVHVADICEDKI